MRGLFTLLCLVLLGLEMPLPGAEPGGRLRVAAAADLQFALADVLAEFAKAQPEIAAEAVYGSSGTLLAQIENGAPFDLFLSADAAFPKRLVEKQLALQESFFPYAHGHLVVWVPTGSKLDLPKLGLRALLEPEVRKVAIANPKVAPYGAAAVAALEQAQLYTEVQPRLVLGENVAQAAQFVQSGAADAGVISLSLALAPRMQSAGRYWELPAGSYPRLEQAGVILSRSRNRAEAEAFRGYLMSAGGKEILTRWGFSLPPAP
jgi:molybdate transport system substrate-binding protein